MRYLAEFLVFLTGSMILFYLVEYNLESLQDFAHPLRAILFLIIFGRYMMMRDGPAGARVGVLAASLLGLLGGAGAIAYLTVPEFREMFQ